MTPRVYLALQDYPKNPAVIHLLKEVPITTERRRREALAGARRQLDKIHPRLRPAAESAIVELEQRKLGVDWQALPGKVKAYLAKDWEQFTYTYERRWRGVREQMAARRKKNES